MLLKQKLCSLQSQMTSRSPSLDVMGGVIMFSNKVMGKFRVWLDSLARGRLDVKLQQLALQLATSNNTVLQWKWHYYLKLMLMNINRTPKTAVLLSQKTFHSSVNASPLSLSSLSSSSPCIYCYTSLISCPLLILPVNVDVLLHTTCLVLAEILQLGLKSWTPNISVLLRWCCITSVFLKVA